MKILATNSIKHVSVSLHSTELLRIGLDGGSRLQAFTIETLQNYAVAHKYFLDSQFLRFDFYFALSFPMTYEEFF